MVKLKIRETEGEVKEFLEIYLEKGPDGVVSVMSNDGKKEKFEFDIFPNKTWQKDLGGHLEDTKKK